VIRAIVLNAAEGGMVNAAEGGKRSIDPAFRPGTTIARLMSPRSGRQKSAAAGVGLLSPASQARKCIGVASPGLKAGPKDLLLPSAAEINPELLRCAHHDGGRR
jgi:hypothetical protein